MTDVQAEIEAPALLERGRHAIVAYPHAVTLEGIGVVAPGSWVIYRAGPICETCENCGCGEQAEPMVLPPFAVKLLMMDPEQRSKINPLALVKKMMSGG